MFDKHGVSFVSVTQQFNTTSSMGRLTLNILLSFAQFEREVTGERIRDKIAASKKKGMWMGGQPPLGYDVKDRKLVVNAQEAETVRHIFRRYLELKSVRLLKADLDAQGIVSKAARQRTAVPTAASRSPAVLSISCCRTGSIAARSSTRTRAIPANTMPSSTSAFGTRSRPFSAPTGSTGLMAAVDNRPSMLAGILFDAQGDRMSPSHATKRGTRYRYYVSRSLIDGTAKTSAGGQRIPAVALEALITRSTRDWLADPGKIHQVIGNEVPDAITQKRLIDRADQVRRRVE